MMKTTSLPINHRTRAGLAPLELIAALPLMLLIMALMVSFGTAAAWKVRVATNARHIAWRELDVRFSNGNTPSPPKWPANGTLSYSQANPDPIEDEFEDHEVVRGPSLTEGSSSKSLKVILETLDISEGLMEGEGNLKRDLALLRRIPPHQFDFTRHHQLLSGTRWTIFDMDIFNNDRRIPITYDYDPQGYDDEAKNRYEEAKAELESIYADSRLFVLDRNAEFAYQQYRLDRNIDFYPRPPDVRYGGSSNFNVNPCNCAQDHPCSMDPNFLLTDLGPEFAELIQGSNRHASVGRTMARTFLSYYQSQLASLDPNDPAVPGLQSTIQQLQHDLDEVFTQ